MAYNQTDFADNNTRRRLDYLEDWKADDNRGLNDLPSTRDSILLAMDLRNSYSSSHFRYYVKPAAKVYYQKEEGGKEIWFHIDVPVNIQKERDAIITAQKLIQLSHFAEGFQLQI